MSTEHYMSTGEAAKYVGVTSMTIRNLCKAGTLKYMKRGVFFYPSTNSVKAYKETLKDVHEISSDIEELRNKLFHERQELCDELDRMREQYRERMANIDMFPRRIEAIKELLHSVLVGISRYVDFIDCDLSRREYDILWDALQGKTFEQIGDKNRISKERVRQLWERGVRKMARLRGNFDELNYKICEMRAELKEKDDEITILKMKLSGEYVDCTKYSTDAINMSKILSMNILDDLSVSVRVKNCLKAYFDCKYGEPATITVRDVVGCHRHTLLKERNFGKKSLTELNEYLESYGLHFGQDVSMYPEYSELLKQQIQS